MRFFFGRVYNMVERLVGHCTVFTFNRCIHGLISRIAQVVNSPKSPRLLLGDHANR